MTRAEYRTVLAVLALPRASERERIRFSELPSSTYNVVRKRVFHEGWLDEVRIPNPGAGGFTGVEFLLARPSVSRRPSLIARCEEDPECVLLWAGVHAVFGIFFRMGEPPGSTSPDAAVVDPTLFRVRVGRTEGTIPVYFDYSGLWARLGGTPRPADYPRGLDASSDPAGLRTESSEGSRVPTGNAPGGPSARWGRLRGPPARRVPSLEQEAVQSRTVLRLGQVPPLEGRRIGEVIFIQGRARTPHSGSSVLNNLIVECGVDPFLAAEANGNVLIAGLGQTDSRKSGRVLVTSAVRPVMTVIAEKLEPADVIIEPVEGIAEVIRHRHRGIPPVASQRTRPPS